MNQSLKKPVTHLSIADLKMHPLWEFALDEAASGVGDETWVRPVFKKEIPGGVTSLIVAANFNTSAGLGVLGFMIVSISKKKYEVTPGALLFESGNYTPLPSVSREEAEREGYTWSLKDRDRIIRAFNSEHGKVFPIKYSLRVRVAGEAEERVGDVV